MSEQAFRDSWWMLTRARGIGWVLRATVLLAPLLALVGLHQAADVSVVAIDVAVVALTLYCVVVPDSHVGLLLVVVVGIGWLAAVDDTTSPWSLFTALALLLFHLALAAASIAGSAAVWSPALRRRWSRRVGVLALACAATWLVVRAVNAYDLASSSALLAAALLLLAAAALWVRDATLTDRATRTPPER
jgi:hypothetical protein